MVISLSLAISGPFSCTLGMNMTPKIPGKAYLGAISSFA
jgi:hypothetical protein